jgi:hypothetical protein
VGRPTATVYFAIYSIFLNPFEFDKVKRWSSVAQKNSYKIWMCSELNKEKLLSLEVFKFWNGI